MQVFTTGTALQTAMALDGKRLNKQTLESRQIMAAIRGESKAWRNHPCTLMYRDHQRWLLAYTQTLVCYRNGQMDRAKRWDRVAKHYTPPFHTADYLAQMRRRLYTKNPDHYRQWAALGESTVNWYFVDGEWRHYRNGKRVA